MGEIAIRTDRLSRDFGAVRAVDDLTLEVPAGIVFGFLGPNGSGKTTTIRLLLGLLEPSSGRAEVLGFDTRRDAAEIRLRTGALLEYPGLYDRLTAEANLDFFGRAWRLPSGERRARTEHLLKQFGLWERRHERVATWSRGMKQKLGIARALLHRPSLVFLDEPTNGLDPVAAAALRDDLAVLVVREGVTIFLTTHNLSEAEKLCRQVAVVRHGRLIAAGSPDDLRARASAQRAEVVGRGFNDAILAALRARPEVTGVERRNGCLLIDLRAGADLASLVTFLVRAGVAIEEVHREQPSLEDAFLSLVEQSP